MSRYFCAPCVVDMPTRDSRIAHTVHGPPRSSSHKADAVDMVDAEEDIPAGTTDDERGEFYMAGQNEGICK